MACNADHLEPDKFELAYSQALCVEDVLGGKQLDRRWWEGFHPKAYCKVINRAQLDAALASACSHLKKCGKKKLATLPLEVRLWWIEHQYHDAIKREKRRDANK